MGDLFNTAYTQGDMSNSAVSFISGYVGMFAVIVISIVGFGIVIASILKNSMDGLYAVAPKFWDRVDEVKKCGIRNREAANRLSGGNNEVMALLGTVSSVLLSIMPNVKAMTSFDGNEGVKDAKSYFMKAIPLMCVQIFIGVFIFYGYPAQVAEAMSEVGTGIFDVVLTNVDPEAWVEALPENMAVLNFSTDGSLNEFEQCVNTAAKKVANTYIGATSDMTKEKRTEMALLIESWVETCMEEARDECDSSKYDMEVTATVYKYGNDPADSVSRINGTHSDTKTADGNYQTVTYAWSTTFDNNGAWSPGVTDDISDWYIRFDCVFTAVATKSTSGNVSGVTLTVPNGNIQTTNGTTITVNLGGDHFILRNSQYKDSVTVTCSDNSTVYGTMTVSGGIATISCNSAPSGQISKITGMTTLKYQINGGAYYYINNIVNGSVTSATLSASGYSDWSVGEDPQAD